MIDADEMDHNDWPCAQENCRRPVEANPTLYLSLDSEGTWSITGVADDCAHVVCTEGHDQHSLILDKSLTAFLEETFPGCTWQGSEPERSEESA